MRIYHYNKREHESSGFRKYAVKQLVELILIIFFESFNLLALIQVLDCHRELIFKLLSKYF